MGPVQEWAQGFCVLLIVKYELSYNVNFQEYDVELSGMCPIISHFVDLQRKIERISLFLTESDLVIIGYIVYYKLLVISFFYQGGTDFAWAHVAIDNIGIDRGVWETIYLEGSNILEFMIL
ncbi:hypothetical protein ACJX0J_030535, partial [Zea mays]